VQLSEHNLSAAMKFPLGLVELPYYGQAADSIEVLGPSDGECHVPSDREASGKRSVVTVSASFTSGFAWINEMPLVPGHCFPTAVAEYTIEDG